MNLRKVLLLAPIFCSNYIFSQTLVVKSWSIEVQTGFVYNFELPLVFKQEGFEDIRIAKAEYHSEPLVFPIYVSTRISRWIGEKNYGLEFIHHKIYLQNCPPEVQSFSISHGFNMLIFNYGMRANSWVLRAGPGLVIAHPESVIRNKEYSYEKGFDPEGYDLSGFAINISGSRPIKFSNIFFINTELKLTVAFANAPIIDGYANVDLITFHLIVGPGIGF